VTNRTPVFVAREARQVEHDHEMDAALVLPAVRGLSVCHMAVLVGHKEIVSLLLAHGARIEAPMDDGRTPLMIAAAGGHLDAVNVLLNAGVDHRAKELGRRNCIWVGVERATRGDRQPVPRPGRSSTRRGVETILHSSPQGVRRRTRRTTDLRRRRGSVQFFRCARHLTQVLSTPRARA
jgi:hypothetical protein